MVEALVLDLGWDPNVAATMPAHEVVFWFEAAVKRQKERAGKP